MKCPACTEGETRVVDSRLSGDGLAVRRRRVCASCEYRFTTLEQAVCPALTVVKKDGRKMPFDRDRLHAGMAKACHKRPVDDDTLQEMTGRIEAALNRPQRTTVRSDELGDMVMEQLRPVDQVAYVRFASVYREFEDVSDFQEQIRPMLPQHPA